MVRNLGKGDAENFEITSGQPVITENEKGLVIDFRILGTTLNDQPQTPSLFVKFGKISAGKTSVAQFLMISSLQGNNNKDDSHYIFSYKFSFLSTHIHTR